MNSCKDFSENQNITNDNVEESLTLNPIFSREKELIEVLNHYNVSTYKSLIVFMPPTPCASCKYAALKVLDTMRNVYILTGDPIVGVPHNSTQKLIFYDPELINKKGLVKLYSAMIFVTNKKVTKYTALTN